MKKYLLAMFLSVAFSTPVVAGDNEGWTCDELSDEVKAAYPAMV